MKRALTAVLALAITTLAYAGNPPAPKDGGLKPAAPSQEILRKLSKRERKERTAKLETRFQDFVADVEPILNSSELDAFLSLESDAQRESFIDDFWRRRDAMMGASGLAFRDQYYARLEVAREQFRKIGSDRAKMFLLHGPPARVVRTECPRILQPVEVWSYAAVPALGQNIRFLFYRPRGHGDYRLWNPVGGSIALQDLVATETLGGSTAEESAARRAITDSSSPYAYISRIQIECRDGDEVLRAITQMVQSRVDLLKLLEPPPLGSEEAQKMLRSVVIANPNAPKLSADFSVRYPGKDGSRTDVQMMLLVPKAQVSPADVGGSEVYVIDVTGEVLRDGRLWEKYRYRFDFAGNFEGEHFPIVIDRFLRPAEYTSRIKVIDVSTGAEAIVEKDLNVPEVFGVEQASTPAPAPQVASGGTPEAYTTPSTTATTAPVEPKLRIVPPPEEIVSGIEKVETLITGDAIKAVEFWLDSRKIAVRRSEPFALDIDFGEVPRMRRIRAVGLDAKGKAVTGDDLFVNTGTDPFRVRITSPRIAPRAVGPTRVEIDARIPEGEELEALELYWNETRMATLYDPPFVQTVNLPSTEGVGYLRAVAKLKDPSVPPVEDVVVINSPAHMEELNVHLIELPTTVLVGGKPASHLTENVFKILDEGQPVSIAKFEYVKNLPLSIGMAVDTSGSMQPRMAEAQKAGAQFLENIMKKGDKAFMVAFSEEPQLVQKWSPKLADLHAGLAKLRADDMTALYDAIVFSLYNFHGIRGQKALVIISDGMDTKSKFTFEQCLEYARRSAVPIYAIAIGLRATEVDVRYKLGKLAGETGGTVYYIETAQDLQKVYDNIQSELRSQYILGFYPAADIKAGSKWREVTVQVNEGKAKTVKGYYP